MRTEDSNDASIVTLNIGRSSPPIFGVIVSAVLFALGAVSNVAFADTQAKLCIEAEVPEEIRLTRIDEGDDLDLFGGNVVTYQIEANTPDGVDITIESQNKGLAKHEERPQCCIGYTLSVRINEEKWSSLAFFPSRVDIPQDKFEAGRCKFSLKSRVNEKIKNIVGGRYTDTLKMVVRARR